MPWHVRLNWYTQLKVHRLVVVDNMNKLEGIISLSDILKYLTGWSDGTGSPVRSDIIKMHKFVINNSNPLRNSHS
ncbi:unnamed protein product [Trichobilharzia regenti]|nr:unnamed protein product [Trichobilharzia regenti]